MIRQRLTSTLAIAAAIGLSLTLSACNDDGTTPTPTPTVSEQNALKTATPIKHLVVIFGENESFDHYFGTYPQENGTTSGQTWVAPANASTHAVENYATHPDLLTNNPNKINYQNGGANSTVAGLTSADQLNPFLILREQFDTTSMNHAYTPEQQATDNLKMDAFVAYTGRVPTRLATGVYNTQAQVMGYFDGATVTALWNYAQNYAMSDNAYTDSFGPSTPGAINVISGTTAGAKSSTGAAIAGSAIDDGTGTSTLTVIGDPDPTGDLCSAGTTVQLGGKNIGDLLNAAKITWGGFMGGFDLTAKNANGTGGGTGTGATLKTGCARSTLSPHSNRTVVDYIPHHAWFQYYASTANINHTRPSSVAKIGHIEDADSANGATAVNHQYDYNDFIAAVSAGNFPSVSYIKAPAYQDAHPNNSNALDEQDFVTKLVNFIMQQPDWASTAIIIAYDDSDGWYDHLAPTILTSSFDATADQVTGAGSCTGPQANSSKGVTGLTVNGRCGPGTRTPFIVISPYAKKNYVDNVMITQSSIVRFIEDNWLGGTLSNGKLSGGQRLGGGSNDAIAGDISGLFDFSQTARTDKFCLDQSTGSTAGRKLTSCPTT